ncbi:uncharacterized protein RCC_02731 [Ramularia collo-cygni]|uniref:Uncharacterized protein n=1 Tax=Ramularia collo-cygni TaxID=112498 RepID=A0A2D3V042_9PEZI|nr:uncharacterized protein RCC_02731 [Ramularia collo-cygni]CZT16896.1 uncharacterized protein RCC_02731 [Ramularia collo-cygni]
MELPKSAVCRECWHLLRQPKYTPRVFAVNFSQRTRQTRPISRPQERRIETPSQHERLRQIRRLATEIPSKRPSTSPTDLTAIHNRIESLYASIFENGDKELPSEQRILYVLEHLESIAQQVSEEEKHDSFGRQRRGEDVPKAAPSASATSTLLNSVNARSSKEPITPQSILTSITTRAEQILRDPSVFITPAILKSYIQLQSLLAQPSSFPDIFHLYAHKPIPTKSSSGTTFAKPSPTKVSAAIDSKTASLALASATATHDLALAIDIITTSFSTPAFRRAKILRKAAIPIGGLALAPCAAYALSQTFSQVQSSMDEGLASGIAFAGIMTYVGAVSMVGYVAVTTANDQMDRVTWASGVPLWERWVREEERAAIDSVAGAWGFQEVEKKGDEEGEEWEALREYVGMKGMVLDKVGLMEGME